MARDSKQERTISQDVLPHFLLPRVLLSSWGVLEAIVRLSLCQL